MILSLINKGTGVYGNNGSPLSATDFMVFDGTGTTDSFNETDPTVPSYVKNITSTQISQWNTAYGWGNHAGLYRPSTWVPNWSEVQNKPLFTRTAPGLVPNPGGSGVTRYLREDGNWATPTGTGGGDSTPDHVNQITQSQINNWDTAYSWGNHATAQYTTLSATDGRYVRKVFGIISSSGVKNWNNAIFGASLGVSINSNGSTNFPDTFGVTYSFMVGYGDANSNNSARSRDFDLWKQKSINNFAIRSYNENTGNPTAWEYIPVSSQINKIWVGTQAQLPTTRLDTTLYFVTD